MKKAAPLNQQQNGLNTPPSVTADIKLSTKSKQLAKKITPVQVAFAGVTLEGIIAKDVAFVALRPIVEGMGLDWSAQLKRVKNDDVLNSVMAVIATTGADGKIYEMICLPEEYLQGWLFTINVYRVKPAIREMVIRYKRECYKVLHQALIQGRIDVQHHALAIESKRALGLLMSDVLCEAILLEGGVPKPYHFMNEHRLVNYAFSGEFSALKEDNLDIEQIRRLANLRRRDAFLIVKGLSYAARKTQLKLYADNLSNQRNLPCA